MSIVVSTVPKIFVVVEIVRIFSTILDVIHFGFGAMYQNDVVAPYGYCLQPIVTDVVVARIY